MVAERRAPNRRFEDDRLEMVWAALQTLDVGLRYVILREIATELNTSEQVIKNYLRKVYDKLGVSDRLELALYCIHHQLLKPPKTENGNGESSTVNGSSPEKQAEEQSVSAEA